jgi:predicted dehydrogenase
MAFTDPDPTATIPGATRVSLTEVLDSSTVGVIAFCVPPALRELHIRQALEASKLVVLEKPPATQLSQLDNLIAAVEYEQLPQVMLQNRMLLRGLPELPKLRDARGYIRISRPRPQSHWTAWRASAQLSGGGAVAHLGIHYLDLAVQHLGPVEAVRVTRCTEISPGIETSIAATAFFQLGSILDIEVTTEEAESSQTMRITGGNGFVEMANGNLKLNVQGFSHSASPRTAASLREEVYQEVRARAHGAPPYRQLLLSSAHETQRLLDYIYRAINQRTTEGLAS